MKLDEALREASAAATRSVEGAEVGEPPSARRPGRARFAVVAVLAAVGLAGAIPLLGGNGDRVTTEAAADRDVGTPALYVTDAPPDGLTLTHAGPVAGLEPIGTETRWIYGQRDQASDRDDPAGGGDQSIVVMALTGHPMPVGLLPGQDADINGRAGRVVADGKVMFQIPEAAIMISGRVSTDDLLVVARGVEVGRDGTILPPAEAPGGFELLGSFEQVFFDEIDGSVPADAQVAAYRQGYERYLSIVSRPRSADDEQLFGSIVPNGAETVQIGERTFTYLVDDGASGASSIRVLWYDEHEIGEVISYGVDRDQLEVALRHLRSAERGFEQPPAGLDQTGLDQTDASDRTNPDTEPPAPVAKPARDSRVAPTLVLNDLQLVTAVDHRNLPAPDWVADQYLYGPPGVEVPSATDPVLLVTVGPASQGLLKGEPIEIGGHRAVIVDKEAAGTSADVEILIGEATVQFTGRANVDLDAVITAGEQYAAWMMAAGGFDSGMPDTIGVGLHLRHTESIAAWFAEDINGPEEATTIVYTEPGSTSADPSARRLTVSITSTTARTENWLSWLHPSATSAVQAGDITATLVRPEPDLTVARFEREGAVIQLVGLGITEQEILAAIESFADGVG